MSSASKELDREIVADRPDVTDPWNDHPALARRFSPGEQVALSPEQLERVRTLGYIR
jgi:hypothetical protein